MSEGNYRSSPLASPAVSSPVVSSPEPKFNRHVRPDHAPALLAVCFESMLCRVQVINTLLIPHLHLVEALLTAVTPPRLRHAVALLPASPICICRIAHDSYSSCLLFNRALIPAQIAERARPPCGVVWRAGHTAMPAACARCGRPSAAGSPQPQRRQTACGSAGQRTSISNNQELGSPLGGHKSARGIAPAAQWNVAAGHFARTSRETIARMTPPRNEVSCNFDPRMTCRGTMPGMRSRRASSIKQDGVLLCFRNREAQP